MENHAQKQEQRIEYARALLWVPFYTVGVAARIRGNVPTDLLQSALIKLLILYPPLASRVRISEDGNAWLTTEGVGECALEIRPWTSGDDWGEIFLEQERRPFSIDQGPLARFLLLRGETFSDLVAVVPHVICDGYSMTHVMWELVTLLNDPDRSVERTAYPPAASWQTVPHALTDDLLLRAFVRGLNHFFPNGRTILHQEKYEELHRQYWVRQQHGLLTFTMSPKETSSLVAQCRQHGVSVTGALLAAFLLAQVDAGVIGTQNRAMISVSVNIRDWMDHSPGRAVGMYASSIDLTLQPNPAKSFWELARQSHARVHRALDNRAQILMPLVLGELDPSITDGLVEALSTGQWKREYRLLDFFLKMRGEKRQMMVSNIGRLDLPETGIPYRLDNLLPFPPLPSGFKLAVNVLTFADQMNIIMKYHRDKWDDVIVAKIRDQVLSYLAAPESPVDGLPRYTPIQQEIIK